MIDLCHCPSPLRDTGSPTRRFHCTRCGGATPSGRRLNLEDVAHLVATAHSVLDRLLTDMTYAHEAVYGLRERPAGEGGPPGGAHSDPVLSAVSQRDDALRLMALAAQWVKQATAWLMNADEAAGLALYKTDGHRGLPDHTPMPYHDTIPTGRPDLAQAHAAKSRRDGRGEL